LIVKLLYDVGDEVYVADVGFENRQIPKGAGFRKYRRQLGQEVLGAAGV